MDLEEIRWENVDWVYLAQDRDLCQVVVNSAINLWVT